jgi:ABC-2 type transport system permease protein
MRHLRLVGLFFKISILNEMQYRANFFTEIVQSILSTLLALGGLAIVFDHTTTLNGWTSADLLAIVGIYFFFGGLIRTAIQPSMQRLMQDIREGTLDYAIIKPIETQFYISFREIKIWKVLDIVIGIALFFIALARMHVELDPANLLVFVVLLVSGGLIVYSFWLMLATITFWFIRVDNILVIFQTMYEAGRWPVRIYPAWMQFILTFIVPVAFAVTVPVEAMTDRLSLETFLLSIGLAFAMLFISHRFWRLGIRSYSGASA